MKKYRKKPLIVEAEQRDHIFFVETMEGTMRGNPGDYLVIGTHLEKYPVKKEIFEANYEEVL
jgi:hypothetical protein